MSRHFVITGGPGSGKTTLARALGLRGVRVVPEAARAIIQSRIDIGLPRPEPELFAELELAVNLVSFVSAQPNALTVFDRGIIDSIAFLEIEGWPVPPHFERAAARYRYDALVFIAPPWRDIYVRDRERTQDFEQAVINHAANVRAYRRYGYHLIELPEVTVDRRAELVLRTIDARSTASSASV